MRVYVTSQFYQRINEEHILCNEAVILVKHCLYMMAVSHIFHYVPLSIFVYRFIYASNIVWKEMNIIYQNVYDLYTIFIILFCYYCMILNVKMWK